MFAGSQEGATHAAPASIPDAWKPWQVVPRALGFHVSRETESGAAREFLRNEVRGVKVFRKRELADAARNAANNTSANQLADFERRLIGAQAAFGDLREQAMRRAAP